MEVSQPASAGDRRYPANRVNFHLRLTTIRHSAARFRGLRITRLSTWGSAALHPRLYADACSAG
jgi:hypothetical protein